MPTRLPDNALVRRPAGDGVTRRTFLRLLAPLTFAAPTSTFTALGDTDVVQRWLRCSLAGPPRIPA